MKRLALFSALAALATAQAIPNRYIVEFSTPPAASVAIANHTRFSLADRDIQSRRAQIRAEHLQSEQSIRSLGGSITHRFDTVLNGMAVTMTPEAAAQLAGTPGVKSVARDKRQRLVLDHAVNVHQISQAWQTIANGQSGAGAGIKIAIFDTGIDLTHPGFQGFTAATPAGFPVATNAAEMANTNAKVIVSRFYSDTAGGVTNTTAVPCTAASATSDCGHGTGTAMIAAGMPHDPKLTGIAQLAGVAPGAWLGNYKVADDTGAGSDVTLIAALEDAVADGMDVINYSFGGPVTDASDETGPVATAIKNAVNAGTLFVTAAGNDGFAGQPAIGAIETPGAVASAITVGANENERFLFTGVQLGTMPPVLAVVPPAEDGNITGQVTGALIDVATLDQNGFGCSALPANSLQNSIALIQRGPIGGACSFDTKVANAQNAGAVGAILYDHTDEPLVDYTTDVITGFDLRLFQLQLTDPTLPTLFAGLKDGQALKQAVAANPGTQATMDFDGTFALPRPANVLVDYSSLGPTPGASIKPDLVAVGDAFITADATFNAPTVPYIYAGGTSLSTPLVTGSLALLKAARPGLTALQYKSLVINGAPEFDQYADGSIAPPQSAGSGILNTFNALSNNLAAAPATLDLANGKSVALTNIGTSTDSFTAVIKPLDKVAVPALDTASFSLDPGKTQQMNLSLDTSSLAPGQYHGFVVVTGSQTPVATRIPYWFAVPGNAVANVDFVHADNQTQGFSGPEGSTGDTLTIYFRAADAANLPFEPAATPTVTTSNARARVLNVQPVGDISGTFSADVVIGRADTNGINTFTITADGKSLDIIVYVF